MQKKKVLSSAIALFLVSSVAFTLLALPNANAHTSAWQIPIYVAIYWALSDVSSAFFVKGAFCDKFSQLLNTLTRMTIVIKFRRK